MTTEDLITQHCPELASAGFDIPALAEMMDERFLGDYQIFFAAVEIYTTNSANYLKDIEVAVQHMNRKDIASTAHRLKGASASFHNLKIVNLTRDMEVNASSWEESQLQAAMVRLHGVVEEFRAELQQLVKSFRKLADAAA